MTNLDSIFKSRDITLPTKVRLVKAMVFPVVMYDVRVGLWRKLSAQELMLLKCGVGEDSWVAYSLPGSSVSGVFQARILEWAAISSSRGSSQPSDWTSISCTGRQFLYHWATSESVEQQEFSFIAGRNAKLYSHSGRPHDSFLWN